jgi:SIT family siderophore-iron:H+ symporter-like MFS transporter
MWAIIYPVSCLVLIGVLAYAQIKARRAGALADYRSPFQTQGMGVFTTLFWQLDVIGILLMIIAFGFFLTPFTLAGGISSSWGEAKIIAPLVIGICFFPVFIFWELKCRYPLLPFHVSVFASITVVCQCGFNDSSCYETGVFGQASVLDAY